MDVPSTREEIEIDTILDLPTILRSPVYIVDVDRFDLLVTRKTADASGAGNRNEWNSCTFLYVLV